MGDLVLKGATSGQITLTPVGTAGTNTLTLPAKTGNIITSADTGTVTQAMLGTNVAGNGPAFFAYLSPSNQSVTSGVDAKVTLNTELFDTNNNFDSTTNYRFTPTVSGYYQVNFAGFGTASTNLVAIYGKIFKNGSAYAASSVNYNTAQSGFNPTVATIIYFNGSTDYVEFYMNVTGTTTSVLAGQAFTYASAALVRAG